MARRSIVRASAAESLLHGRLWLTQVWANALLFALFVVWLLIPAASGWYITLNVVVALAIVTSAIVLYGGTLNYFHDIERDRAARLKPAFLRALRHALAIAVCAAAFYFAWMLMNRADAYQDSLPAYLRSMMPVFVRQRVTLAFLTSVFSWISFAARYIAIPALLLPFTLSTSDLGFRGFLRAGFRAWTSAVTRFTYWLGLAVAAVIGVLATQAMVGWTPDFTTSTFKREAFSLAGRLICASALGIWAWLFACSVVARASAASDSGAAASGIRP